MDDDFELVLVPEPEQAPPAVIELVNEIEQMKADLWAKSPKTVIGIDARNKAVEALDTAAAFLTTILMVEPKL